MTDLMQKVEFVITTQQAAVLRSGKPIMADDRSAYVQLTELLNLARKLKMTKAVAWLQPKVLQLSEKGE